jgi:hypothetical protein
MEVLYPFLPYYLPQQYAWKLLFAIL